MQLKTLIRFLRAGALKNLVEEIKFLHGQGSILSSRAQHQNFRNLWDAEVKVYSQWGEDGILDYICERIGLSKPRVLEIGAGNFSECNSRFLAENRNASVFAVDGREDLISSIETNPLRWKNHIFGQQIWVTPTNINSIIDSAHRAIDQIDIFSLDLDGNDYWILEKANLSSISVIVVEYNALFGHSEAVSVQQDDAFERNAKHFSSLYYGASLKAFVYLLKKREFEFIGTNRVGNNAFFIHRNLISRIPLTANDDYSVYTDWRIREARSERGVLTYESGQNRMEIIGQLEVIDVKTNEIRLIRDILVSQ